MTVYEKLENEYYGEWGWDFNLEAFRTDVAKEYGMGDYSEEKLDEFFLFVFEQIDTTEPFETLEFVQNMSRIIN